MKNIIFSIIVFLSFTSSGVSQVNSAYFKVDSAHLKRPTVDMEKHISVLLGFNGWRYHFLEAGIALNEYGRIGYHPFARSIFIADEIKIGRKMIMAPKIGAWIAGGISGMAMGANLLCYTDFKKSSLRFRPEFGFGFGKFKVVYGYNIAITNKRFQGINKSCIAAAYMFGVKKIKRL